MLRLLNRWASRSSRNEAANLQGVTINLLKDLSQWEARRTLLVQELVALKPDLIALQEVALPQNNA